MKRIAWVICYFVAAVLGAATVWELPKGTVFAENGKKTERKFPSGTLFGKEGMISITFQPQYATLGGDYQVNRLFSSGGISAGFNLNRNECAVWFFTKPQEGPNGGVYQKTVLKSGETYTLYCAYDAWEIWIFLNGKYLGKAPRGKDIGFGSEFSIGDSASTDSVILKTEIDNKVKRPPAKKADIPAPAAPAALNSAPPFLTPQASGTPFRAPLAALADKSNLLSCGDLRQTRPFAVAESKKFQTLGGVIPINWSLSIAGATENTAGSSRLIPARAVNGAEIQVWELTLPENNWFTAEAVCMQRIPQRAAKAEDYPAFGFWARGEGVVALKIDDFDATGKRRKRTQEEFLLEQQWRFFRSKPYPMQKDGSLGLILAPYGRMEFALPEAAPIPAVDPAAELTFYLPFEETLEASFARGPAHPYGVDNPGKYVDGIAGKALRLDRKPGFTPDRWIMMPMGLRYANTEEVVPAENGTVELWFRPTPSILENTPWPTYSLFALGLDNYQWRGSNGLEVYLTRHGKSLRLNLREQDKSIRFDTGDRNASVTTLLGCEIGAATEMIGKWQHLALTYSDKERVLYLNGKRVLSGKAPKRPAIIRNQTFHIGTPNQATPFLPCADLDEFRIYAGVRYHRDFTPEAGALLFRTPDSPGVAGAANRDITAGPLTLNVEKNALQCELRCGDSRYLLECTLGDGYPLVFSSKGALMQISAERHPKMPRTVWSETAIDGFTARGTIAGSNTVWEWIIKPENGTIRVELKLKQGNGHWRALLEPRLRLTARDGAFAMGFDGFSTRSVRLPFRPFRQTGLINFLPLAAGTRSGGAVALALDPKQFVSYAATGLSAPETLALDIRTVLDPGETGKYSFQIFPVGTGAVLAENAVQGYHDRNTETFQRDPAADSRFYTNNALAEQWDSPDFRKRSAQFSMQELNRRARAGWCWYYTTGSTTGNWALDPEVLRYLPEVNSPRIGGKRFLRNTPERRAAAFERRSRSNIADGFYILSYLEKRFAGYFSDSLFDAADVENGCAYLDNWWWVGLRDHVALASGTAFGDWMRRQIRDVIQRNQVLTGICFDVAEGDHKFRKDNRMGPMRAFDERGVYCHNLVGIGALAQFIREQKSLSGSRMAVIGNGSMSGGFPVMFHLDGNIYERLYFIVNQDRRLMRLYAWMGGEKSMTSYGFLHKEITGNYFDAVKEDQRLLRYIVLGERMQTMLLGFLYNVNLSYENVYGVREIVEGLDDLARVHALGWRSASFSNISAPLQCARYGSPERGSWVAVNPGWTQEKSVLKLQCSELGSIPLLARSGGELLVTAANGVADTDVAPDALGYEILDSFGALRGGDGVTSYRSHLSNKPEKRLLTVTFSRNASFSSLETRLIGGEVLASLALNSKEMPRKVVGNSVTVIAPQFRTGDVLTLEIVSPRWKTTGEAVMAYPFLGGDTVLTYDGEMAKTAAERVAEYFRFWTKLQPGGTEVKLPVRNAKLASGTGKRLFFRIAEQPEIALNGSILTIAAPQESLLALTDEVLTVLDHRYRYYGVFGNQRPMEALDKTAIPEQSALLKRADVLGKSFSIRDIAREYRKYRQEKGQ